MKEYYVGDRVKVIEGRDIPADKIRQGVIQNSGRSGVVVDRYSLDGDDYIYIIKFDGDKMPSWTAFTADMIEQIPETNFELKVEKKNGRVYLSIYESGELVKYAYGKINDETATGFATAILCGAKKLHSFIIQEGEQK